MSTEPLVSVLLAVRNGQRYLADAVDSILGQTLPSFELVIVDDGSDDATRDIVDAYSDPRIVAFHREPRGLPASLNFGLHVARAPLIARMDADDVCLPYRLSLQRAALLRQPDVAVLGSGVEIIDKDGKPTGERCIPPSDHHALVSNMLQARGCSFVHPSVMYRKEAVLNIGGYCERLAASQDVDLWLRLSCFYAIGSVPDVLLRFRRHEASMSVSRRDVQLTCGVLSRVSYYLRKSGFPDPARLSDEEWRLFESSVVGELRRKGVYSADRARQALIACGGRSHDVSGIAACALAVARRPELLLAFVSWRRWRMAIRTLVRQAQDSATWPPSSAGN